jgi:hypothetical protein
LVVSLVVPVLAYRWGVTVGRRDFALGGSRFAVFVG